MTGAATDEATPPTSPSLPTSTIDRLRIAIGRADALAAAARDLLAAIRVDDARGHERVSILIEMTADATADAWEAAMAVISLLERTASERTRNVRRPTEATP